MRLALALVAALTAVAPALSATRPTVRLVSLSPVAVRGAGFSPGERIVVLATGDAGVVEKRLKAGPRGGFVLVFPFEAGRCTSFGVNAVGGRGHRAQLEFTSACDPDPGQT
jgi:hypothetical protein